MKVKMNYGIELENILEATEKLYHEARVDFDSSYKGICKDLRFTDEDFREDLVRIQYMHIALTDFSAKLQDVFNILRGYEEILSGPPPETQQGPPESEFAPEEPTMTEEENG